MMSLSREAGKAREASPLMGIVAVDEIESVSKMQVYWLRRGFSFGT